MSLLVKLTEDMKNSMRAGDPDRTGMVRLLLSSLKNEQIKVGHELSDEEALKVLQRESKQRKDAAELYRGAGRDDLLAKEEYELTVVAEYLPQLLNEDETRALVDKAIADLGGEVTQQQMGAVISAVRQQGGASVDGALVAKLVRERLSA
jgi:uncharacterized protein YqeY